MGKSHSKNEKDWLGKREGMTPTMEGLSRNKQVTMTPHSHRITSMIHQSFILELFILVLPLQSIWKIKYRLLSNQLFQRESEHGGWRDIRASVSFYKKQYLSVMRWNKSHLSKQVVTITYTLKKNCFAIATFEGLAVISFQPESKNV